MFPPVLFLRSESRLIHRYTNPSTCVVAVDCTSGDMHVTSQKTITILEPVTDISVTRCYTGTQNFHATHCKALYGAALQMQMEVKTGRKCHWSFCQIWYLCMKVTACTCTSFILFVNIFRKWCLHANNENSALSYPVIHDKTRFRVI